MVGEVARVFWSNEVCGAGGPRSASLPSTDRAILPARIDSSSLVVSSSYSYG
jgi:hypothetical protein